MSKFSSAYLAALLAAGGCAAPGASRSDGPVAEARARVQTPALDDFVRDSLAKTHEDFPARDFPAIVFLPLPEEQQLVTHSFQARLLTSIGKAAGKRKAAYEIFMEGVPNQKAQAAVEAFNKTGDAETLEKTLAAIGYAGDTPNPDDLRNALAVKLTAAREAGFAIRCLGGEFSPDVAKVRRELLEAKAQFEAALKKNPQPYQEIPKLIEALAKREKEYFELSHGSWIGAWAEEIKKARGQFDVVVVEAPEDRVTQDGQVITSMAQRLFDFTKWEDERTERETHPIPIAVFNLEFQKYGPRKGGMKVGYKPMYRLRTIGTKPGEGDEFTAPFPPTEITVGLTGNALPDVVSPAR